MEAVTQRIAVPLMLGDVVIDHRNYDEEADVLYLTAGRPRLAADTDESSEGDTVFVDAHGRIIGITVIGAREMLDRDGTLNVTLPSLGFAVRWPREVVEPLLVETLRYA